MYEDAYEHFEIAMLWQWLLKYLLLASSKAPKNITSIFTDLAVPASVPASVPSPGVPAAVPATVPAPVVPINNPPAITRQCKYYSSITVK